jgi:hypothetical protein
MKTVVLAGLCALVLLAAPARGQKIGCVTLEDLHPGGQRKTELTLALVGDEVVGILYDVTIANKGRDGVSTCHIALADDDGLSRWTRAGTSIRVVDTSRVEDSLDGAYTQVDILPDGYRLSLTHLSHNHCSNDADVQQTVTLKKGDPACTVVYKAAAPR